MSLTEKDIGEFKELWHRQTGEHLNTEQAKVHAENLLALVQFVVEPQVPGHEEPP